MIFRAFTLGLSLGAAVLSSSAQITLHDDRVFPESITSSPDGTIFIGSMGKGEVLRAEKGAAIAEVWIKPGTAGLQQVAGVYADAYSNTLWVCSTKLGSGGAPPAVKKFDLKTAAFKESYDFPGGTGICNDFAIAADGTAYVTDTSGQRVLRLKKGATALDIWAQGPKLAGADGIAFGAQDTLYVNSISSGHLLRIPVTNDGSAGEIVEIKLPEPLKGPDGMRAVGTNKFLVAEGRAGLLTLVTVTGDEAKAEVLRDGLTGISALAQVGDTVWVNDFKSRLMRDPSADPGTFMLEPVAFDKERRLSRSR